MSEEAGVAAEDTVRQTKIFLENIRMYLASDDNTTKYAHQLCALQTLNDAIANLLFFYSRTTMTVDSKTELHSQ